MTTRTLLRGMHQANAEHNVALGKAHRKAASHFAKLAEGADGDQAEHFQGASDAHSQAASAHADAANYSLECCKALDSSRKAMMDGDGDRIRPDGISSVYKNDNLRAVPRFGSPQPAELVDVSAVDPAFKKLYEVDDSLD